MTPPYHGWPTQRRHDGRKLSAMELSVGAASRAWYRAALDDFRERSPQRILGALAHAAGDVRSTERDAWLAEIDAIQDQTRGLAGSILLEFSIPRMGRRIDAVLLIGPVIFVLEFKAGAD